MPMAGRGSRFAKAGVKTPKPLIIVDGQQMYLKALSSLDNIQADKKLTVVIRAEHDQEHNLSDGLRQTFPGVNIAVSDDEPTGAVVDALRAEPFLQADEAVILLDCDLWFSSASYNKMVEDRLNGQTDINGGLLTFAADNPRYSYAKINSDNIVTETAEKRVISDHAITGAYFFASKAEFVDSAHKLLKQPLSETMPEYYISFLYNILIDEGKKIQAAFVDEFASFGTPEELASYNANH